MATLEIGGAIVFANDDGGRERKSRYNCMSNQGVVRATFSHKNAQRQGQVEFTTVISRTMLQALQV